jgi:hypothetical protein
MTDSRPHAPENAAEDRAAASHQAFPVVVDSRSDAPPLPVHLDRLADRARDCAAAASSVNTRCAYATDWKHFAPWCRRQGLSPLPDPQIVGLHITA